MRISEAYEHESILPYPAEESCPVNGCSKISTQCVDVTAPVVLTPTADVGAVTVACQGTPCITCTTDPCGTSCRVTLTQQICISVPVKYGVTLAAEPPVISCGENCVGGGCC